MGRADREDRRSFMRRLVLGSELGSNNPDGHTLVIIFLRGGADTLNMLVPCQDKQYYVTRPNLAIPAPAKSGTISGASLKLTDFYAVHPKMKPLIPVFSEGRLGIVQAVGTDNTSGSHFEAQDQMEHGESYGHSTDGGWLGRFLRARSTINHVASTPLSAVAIGTAVPESLRGAPAASAITSVDEIRLTTPTGDTALATAALSRMYSTPIAILSEAGKDTLALIKKVEKLQQKQYKPANNVEYPDTSFGKGLREIGRLVKANVGLEVASVDLGNWDTHFFQGTADGLQAANIDELAKTLAAFDGDLHGYHDRVTTLVMTEFGRRTYENASLGTDHGRGFALFAMGSRINGGKIHGEWPGLEEQDQDILGPSGLPVLFDYRSVLSEILTNTLGMRDTTSVFPQFKPQRVGLAKGSSSSHLL
jgi:uncharacterized protein (DUF1501 family)